MISNLKIDADSLNDSRRPDHFMSKRGLEVRIKNRSYIWTIQMDPDHINDTPLGPSKIEV